MTKLLDDALSAVRNLPPDEQDNVARAVLRLTGADEEPSVALSGDERAAIVFGQHPGGAVGIAGLSRQAVAT